MTEQAKLKRIRYVTAHFEILQGLAVLPAILWCALAMSWAAGWVDGWAPLVGAFVAVAATGAAVVHYRRVYGQVRPHAGGTHETFLLWPSVGLFVAVSLVHALELGAPVSLEGLVLAGGALAGAWFQRPLAPALLLAGCVGAALSLAPLGGPDGPHPLSDTETWIFAFCAGTALLAIWSHLLLRRTLPPGRGSAR